MPFIKIHVWEGGARGGTGDQQRELRKLPYF